MDRPRRSTRAPPRTRQKTSPGNSPTKATSSASAKPTKRKPRDFDPDEPQSFLNYLVANPKSLLTRMDISDVVNASAWSMLPEEDRAELVKLIPPTAFDDFEPYLDDFHPSVDQDQRSRKDAGPPQPKTPEPESMDVDSDQKVAQPASSSSKDPTPLREPSAAFFSDSQYFLAAAHTWQDHIYSKWTSDAHKEKVTKYLEGVQNGTLAAPWKDEVWERDHKPVAVVDDAETDAPTTRKGKGQGKAIADSSLNSIAGEAREVRLPTLVKAEVFRAGDIISYRRNFFQSTATVQKDVLIESIGKGHSLNVLFEPGETPNLPRSLLLPNPAGPEEGSSILSATITTPTMLETAILDTDGRVDKTKRANSNAWKHFTVYRWRGDGVGDLENERGGRENHGTMFYLRGTYYHER